MAHGRTSKSSRVARFSLQDQPSTSLQLPDAPLHRSRPLYAADCAKLSQPAPLGSVSLLSSVSQVGNACQHYPQPSDSSNGPTAARQGLQRTAFGAKPQSQDSQAEVQVSMQLPGSPIRPISRASAETGPAAAKIPDPGAFAAHFLNSTALVDKPPQLDSLCKARFSSESLHDPHRVSPAYPVYAVDSDFAGHGRQLLEAVPGRKTMAGFLADNSVHFPLRQSDFSRYGINAQLLDIFLQTCWVGKGLMTFPA